MSEDSGVGKLGTGVKGVNLNFDPFGEDLKQILTTKYDAAGKHPSRQIISGVESPAASSNQVALYDRTKAENDLHDNSYESDDNNTSNKRSRMSHFPFNRHNNSSDVTGQPASPRKKAFNSTEKRRLLLVVFELGAVLEWSITEMVEHLRKSNWDNPLGSGVSKNKAVKLGWTAADTLEKKFNAPSKIGSGRELILRQGSSLKNAWQNMCGKIKNKDPKVTIDELIVGDEFGKEISKVLEMNTQDLMEIRAAARDKFQTIKAAFVATTSKNSTPTKCS